MSPSGMEQFLSAVTAVLAAAGSLVAVLVAVDQLTVGARGRRRAEAFRGALEAETDPHSPQAIVLESLHRATVGRLVALDAVGGWRIVAGVLLLGFGMTLSFLVGFVLQRVVIMTYTTEDWMSPSGWLAACLFLTMSWGISLAGALFLLLALRNRREIARCYIAGSSPLVRTPFAGSGLRYPRSIRLGVGTSIGTTLFSLGLGAQFGGGPEGFSWAGWVLWALGLGVTGVFVAAVVRFVGDGPLPTWQFPSEAAAPPLGGAGAEVDSHANEPLPTPNQAQEEQV